MNRFVHWGVTLVALTIAAPARATPILLASATSSINGGAGTSCTNRVTGSLTMRGLGVAGLVAGEAR